MKYTKEQIIRSQRWFPSPCGEKVGINWSQECYKRSIERFRPLAGKR